MNTYLIIGASGCIGFETAKWLLQNRPNDKVITCSRGKTNFPEKLDSAIHELGDISSPESILKIMQKHNITHVLHCAALRTTDCNNDPAKAYQINVKGTINTAKAAQEAETVREFIFISTAAVYDQVESQSADICENDPVKKYASYVSTKLESEEQLKEFSEKSSISVTVIRPQILFGPTRSLEGSTAGVTNCIRSGALGEDFQIPFSGQYSFHFTGDVGRLIGTVLVAEKNYSYEIFNLPGSSHKVSDFCTEVNSLTQRKNSISFIEKQYPFAISVSHDKYSKFFGSPAISPFKSAIKETFDHFKN